jgi:cytochrome P450
LPEPEGDNAPSLMERLQNLSNPAYFSRKAFGGKKMVKDKLLSVLPVLAINDIKLVKAVASLEFNGLSSFNPPAVSLLLGSSSVGQVNDQTSHKRIRYIMYKSFGPEAVFSYIPKIQRTARRVIEEAERKGQVKAEQLMKKFAFSVIVQLVVSEDLKSEAVDELMASFENISQGLFDVFPYDLPFLPFSKSLQSREKISKFVQEQVDLVRKGASGSSETFIARLVNTVDEEGKGLSDQEIVDNTIAILSAGLDTTACSLTNALYFLSDHPEAWQKMRAEQMELAQHGPSISPADLQRMPYTEGVVKESLRLFPPLSTSLMRTATRDLALDGYLIPKGLPVLYMLQFIIEDGWKDLDVDHPFHPARFAPERHLDEEGSKQGGSMVYFGMGPRICPGQYLSMLEQKLFLAELVRNWDYCADLGERKHLAFILPFPSNGLPITVKSHWR